MTTGLHLASVYEDHDTGAGHPECAARNAAVRKAEETSAEKMGKLTQGMPGLPGGMKFPF